MTYHVGQVLVMTADGYPGGYFTKGERVEVLEVPADGVPIVGALGTEDAPIGKAVRLHEELEDRFTPAR
jgi:hypothetical protein